jgi:Ca2+-binding RTX toxin-like protein
MNVATYTRSNEPFAGGAWNDQAINWAVASLGAVPQDSSQHYRANSDGTYTFFLSAASNLNAGGDGVPTGGTVSSLQRVSWNGVSITTLENIDLTSAVSFVTLYQQAQAGTLIEFVLGGSDSVTGGNQDDTLFGYDGVDDISGNAGNDTIFGGGGNDIIKDFLGASTIIDAGADDDTIHISNTFTSGTIDGGAGTDILVATVLNTNLSFLNIVNVEILEVGFSGGLGFASQFQALDTIRHSAGMLNQQISINLVASGGSTTLDLSGKLSDNGGRAIFVVGSSDGETITAGALNDTIFGEDGSDILDGGAGLDFVDAGGGDDTVISSSAKVAPAKTWTAARTSTISSSIAATSQVSSTLISSTRPAMSSLRWPMVPGSRTSNA